MKKVGIEQSLSDVRAVLEQKGYELVDLKTEQDAANCDCCVITGQDRNVMGMMDTQTNSAVIDAHGKTVEEVCGEVDARFSAQ